VQREHFPAPLLRFVVDLLCIMLCNISKTNRSSGVGAYIPKSTKVALAFANNMW